MHPPTSRNHPKHREKPGKAPRSAAMASYNVIRAGADSDVPPGGVGWPCDLEALSRSVARSLARQQRFSIPMRTPWPVVIHRSRFGASFSSSTTSGSRSTGWCRSAVGGRASSHACVSGRAPRGASMHDRRARTTRAGTPGSPAAAQRGVAGGPEPLGEAVPRREAVGDRRQRVRGHAVVVAVSHADRARASVVEPRPGPRSARAGYSGPLSRRRTSASRRTSRPEPRPGRGMACVRLAPGSAASAVVVGAGPRAPAVPQVEDSAHEGAAARRARPRALGGCRCPAPRSSDA